MRLAVLRNRGCEVSWISNVPPLFSHFLFSSFVRPDHGEKVDGSAGDPPRFLLDKGRDPSSPRPPHIFNTRFVLFFPATGARASRDSRYAFFLFIIIIIIIIVIIFTFCSLTKRAADAPAAPRRRSQSPPARFVDRRNDAFQRAP